MSDANEYYAIMDETKHHIKIDVVTGRLYLFDTKAFAGKELSYLLKDGYGDLHRDPVLVEINRRFV